MGEQYVLQCLKKKLVETFSNAIVEESSAGFNICRSGECIAEVHWLNKIGDRKKVMT